MGEVSDSKLDKMIKKFETANGSKVKDFNQKEIIIMLNSELKDDIKTLSTKLDKYVEKGEHEQEKNMGLFHEHAIIMKELVDAMPEKGWCERVNNALFPTAPELPLAYKVSTMWHDRRWTKAIILMLIGTGGVSLINLILFIMRT